MITRATTGPGPRIVEFDPEALYQAVDKQRRMRRISMREVLRQIGERTPSTMTRLGQGHIVSADTLVRLMHWLGHDDISAFVRYVHDEEADTSA